MPLQGVPVPGLPTDGPFVASLPYETQLRGHRPVESNATVRRAETVRKRLWAVLYNERVEQLCEKYADVFNGELGQVKGVQAKVRVADDAVPKFCKARPVPYALREEVDKHLGELEKQGVITPIEYSEWASPIVCLPKKRGKVRICGDCKVGVNEWVEVDQYRTSGCAM